MLVKFWGVRGSVPVPGTTTIKYGGNTACIEVRCGKDIIIIDGGTGLRLLGLDLMKRGFAPGSKTAEGKGRLIYFSATCTGTTFRDFLFSVPPLSREISLIFMDLSISMSIWRRLL